MVHEIRKPDGTATVEISQPDCGKQRISRKMDAAPHGAGCPQFQVRGSFPPHPRNGAGLQPRLLCLSFFGSSAASSLSSDPYCFPFQGFSPVTFVIPLCKSGCIHCLAACIEGLDLKSIDYFGGPVSSSAETTFVRRQNANGSTHSICTCCFITVATATRQADLDQAEQRHICDPWLVAHWKELASRSPSDGWDQKPPRR